MGVHQADLEREKSQKLSILEKKEALEKEIAMLKEEMEAQAEKKKRDMTRNLKSRDWR